MNTTRTVAVTALAPLTWGTTYLVTTEFLPDHRPLLTATIRALPAGLAILAATRVLPRGDWWWKAAVLGTLNIGAFFALMFVSAYRLPGGIAATLAAINPLITAVLAGAVLSERVSRVARLAAVAGLVGVAMLVITPSAHLDAWGIAAGLAAAASTSAGVMLTKRWGRPVPLITFTGWQLVAGGLVLLIPMLLVEGLPPALTAQNIAGYLWLTLPGTALAYVLWFGGVLRLPAARVSLLSFLTPLTAAALGWWLLGQSLTLVQLVGGAVVLGAVGAGALAGRRPATPPSATPLPALSGASRSR
ncbi:EamA family transporter [Demequina sp. NBRC 110055]|uniref:EamA family transporter n=1 Tax=Demequina sp. NBRC 110055 TaxID=1570344 RepID=UPI000A05BB09|nr:EamA family transporter [Demequina sp. NBRC 110055]